MTLKRATEEKLSIIVQYVVDEVVFMKLRVPGGERAAGDGQMCPDICGQRRAAS